MKKLLAAPDALVEELHNVPEGGKSDPDNPTIYRRGDLAEAEPALPGWRMAVDEILE